MRRLEVRIGELSGPAEPVAGPGRGKASVANDGLSRDERHDFRQMAAHPEVVERVRRAWPAPCPGEGCRSSHASKIAAVAKVVVMTDDCTCTSMAVPETASKNAGSEDHFPAACAWLVRIGSVCAPSWSA